MENIKYEKKIYMRLEKKFDIVMLPISVMTWIAVIVIVFSELPFRFVIVDSCAAITFTVIAIMKEKISIQVKTYVAMIFPMIIGTMSFFDGGFESSGVALLLISNLIGVLFLDKKNSSYIRIITLMVFTSVFLLAVMGYIPKLAHIHYSLWLVLFIVMILFLFVLHVMVYAIKDYLIAIIVDIEKTGEMTYQLAYYDSLSGLPNYTFFNEKLSTSVSKVGEFIIVAKIKNYDLIRSLYGDEAAEQVIIEIIDLFKALKKEIDLLFRVSENEFAVWVKESSMSKVMKVLKYGHDELKGNPNLSYVTKTANLFFTYVKCDGGNHYVIDCYHKAQMAMTYAIRNQNIGITAYDEKLEKIIRREEQVKKLLKRAIYNEAFVMHYQTKVRSDSKKVKGVEALARWFPEELGSVSPVEFIPLIERINRVVEFGEVVIERTFKDYKKLCAIYGENVEISINISPSHFKDRHFISYITQMVEKYKVNPKQIILEITEEIMIENVDSIKNIIKQLNDIGIRASIDDFGSGYSSFSYLGELPVSELKIDRSLIIQIEESEKYENVIKGIVAMSKDLNLELVAEGVETEEQFLKLKNMGCPVIQGYYFSKPTALEEVIV